MPHAILPNANTEQPSFDQNQLFIDAAEISRLNSHALIVGSVGRAAIMGEAIDPVRPSGVKRDLDILRMGERPGGSGVDPSGYKDYIFENWITPDGSHLVFPGDASLSVPVKYPEIFEPRPVRVGDLVVSTPHPDVLSKISTMQYIQRPKDKVAAAVFETFLDSQPDRLPPEALVSFDVFRNALSHRMSYRLSGVLRNAYHRTIPESSRKHLLIGEYMHWLRGGQS